ncbi:hypothetical protein [Brachybacterium sacelli]|uniref:hypothetical protein n=1 Tax=Brachybacterium sacelli TaxID=173364 RepID=UPI003620F879
MASPAVPSTVLTSGAHSPGSALDRSARRSSTCWDSTLEQITVAGHPEPIPASAVAAALLQQRLETARETRGTEAAETLEELVGARIGTLLEGGMPSIDLATMRSIVDFVETPVEEDNASGVGRALRGVKEKLAQRGGPVGR